jgi:hypothetical protein
MAGFTSHTKKTGFQAAAAQVILELPPHIIRQLPALGRPLRFKSGIIFFDKLVKERPLRTMAFVFDRTTISAGFPASRHLQHDRVLAMECLC